MDASQPGSSAPPSRSENLASIADEAESGGLRAAVLGINDGLVTNLSLILGVSGASANAEFVKLAGLASLVAGACSMAVGEYVSMQAQVELLQRVLKSVRSAFNDDTARATGLGAAFAREGLSPKIAAEAADDLAHDDDKSAQLYSRAVLGINPDDLGSPWVAAAASLLTFAVGAVVPLLPWYFLPPATASAVSIGVSVASAFIIGALLGSRTDGRVLQGGIRQVIVIVLAAGVTYGVGRLLHVSVQ